MDSLAWLEQTDLSTWLRESDWGFPIMLCFHAVGMGLVVGISLMFSARVLGYAKAFPLSAFDRLFTIASRALDRGETTVARRVLDHVRRDAATDLRAAALADRVGRR